MPALMAWILHSASCPLRENLVQNGLCRFLDIKCRIWVFDRMQASRRLIAMITNLRSPKSLLFFSAVSLLACLGATTAQAALTTGLEANWRLDETSGAFADATGNGHTGTAVGSPWGSGTNGLLDGAVALNGSTDWVRSGDMANFAITDSFSGSMWLKLDANPTEFNFFMGQQSTDGGVAGWRVGNGDVHNRSRVRLILQDGNSSTYLDSPEGTLNSTDWLHLAFTYNGVGHRGGMVLYVNGVALASAGGHNNLTINSDITTATGTNFSIGARDADGGGTVAGLIDEVGLWNRVLTQEEVTTLYNGGSGMQIIPEPATTAALLLTVVFGLTVMRCRR